jgi:hypothetical protein
VARVCATALPPWWSPLGLLFVPRAGDFPHLLLRASDHTCTALFSNAMYSIGVAGPREPCGAFIAARTWRGRPCAEVSVPGRGVGNSLAGRRAGARTGTGTGDKGGTGAGAAPPLPALRRQAGAARWAWAVVGQWARGRVGGPRGRPRASPPSAPCPMCEESRFRGFAVELFENPSWTRAFTSRG